MIRILPLVILLAGCVNSGIMVQEDEGTCTLSGAMFAPTILDQPPPEPGSIEYHFIYDGEQCTVVVRNGEVLIPEQK